MSHLVINKAISLLLLIMVGYLLKPKFSSETSVGAIRAFILSAALPATIFSSTIEIDTRLDLVLLPSFALAVNLYLMLIGFGLTYLLIPKTEKSKRRALVLLFPSLAPGLTVYPFVEQFLGTQGLAWAALADMGNKFFVLIGLYALAIIWYQGKAKCSNSEIKPHWQQIGLFLLSEPVNLAIVLGVILATSGIKSVSLPVAVLDTIQKLALCATPLILVYVGISLNLKSLRLGTILMVLLARAGAGFLLSAAAIALIRPTSEITMLMIAVPQASCSLWSLLHGTRINQQSSEKNQKLFFDTEFATALLAMSFPFSIAVLLIVFSSGSFFSSTVHLGLIGIALLGIFSLFLLLRQMSIGWQNSIVVSLRSSFKPKPKNQEYLKEKALPIETKHVQDSQSHLHRLKDINQIVTRYLHSEIKDPNVALKIQYLIKGRVLVILGQHKDGHFISLDIVFQHLEKEIKLLELEFLDQIRFCFKYIDQKELYTCYSLTLDSPANNPCS
ncbi:hypothetical protein [Leptolyngbya sp. FACHB-17]|uniref:AEC family transporter n=1 Tax=unclassified Leptolyngbya TaxID=2650499 RepID=UPI001A7E3050|nr:hypothetical protein [Leptolyngbya sp. FACHB-17]